MLINGSKLPDDKARRPLQQALAFRRALAEQVDALAQLPAPTSPAETKARARLALQLGAAWERIQRRIEQSPQHQYRKRMKAKLAAAAKGLASAGEVKPKTLRKPSQGPKPSAPATPDPGKEPSAGGANSLR